MKYFDLNCIDLLIYILNFLYKKTCWSNLGIFFKKELNLAVNNLLAALHLAVNNLFNPYWREQSHQGSLPCLPNLEECSHWCHCWLPQTPRLESFLGYQAGLTEICYCLWKEHLVSGQKAVVGYCLRIHWTLHQDIWGNAKWKQHQETDH